MPRGLPRRGMRHLNAGMEKMRFGEQVDAPVYTVWAAMLGPEGYREWTGVFSPGSYFDGSWDEGSVIRFLGPGGDDGEGFGGLAAVVEENRTHEYVSLRYTAEIADGVENTESPIVGVHETYAFSERDGATTVDVELDSVPGYTDMMSDVWPQGLAKLKEIAERA
jgi:uncharacterized protein YndB with AHSA1/START domain